LTASASLKLAFDKLAFDLGKQRRQIGFPRKALRSRQDAAVGQPRITLCHADPTRILKSGSLACPRSLKVQSPVRAP